MERTFTTTGGAARILGLSEATVRDLVRRGQLSAIRTDSGVRLFDRREVEALATTRADRVQAAAEVK